MIPITAYPQWSVEVGASWYGVGPLQSVLYVIEENDALRNTV